MGSGGVLPAHDAHVQSLAVGGDGGGAGGSSTARCNGGKQEQKQSNFQHIAQASRPIRILQYFHFYLILM
mgnify:CR=1 FL=1